MKPYGVPSLYSHFQGGSAEKTAEIYGANTYESLSNKIITSTTKNHSHTMRLKEYLEIGSVNPSQNVHLSIVFFQVR